MVRALLVVSLATVLLAAPARGADDLEALTAALAAAADSAERGLLQKRIGDHFSAAGDYRKAAEPYAQALALARDRFTAEERFAIATRLSWGGRPQESLDELSRILSENPGNAGARLQRARVLSWTGRHGEAVAEVERVLAASPGNSDALLVKANVLRWKGDAASSVPLYEEILAKRENFDARLGLAHAILASGDPAGAREAAALLKPQHAYQEKELAELKAALGKATRPALDLKYSYYHDSDGNDVNRYAASVGVPSGRARTELGYRRTEANDPTRDERSDDFWVRTYARLAAGRLGFGAGIGATRAGHDNANTLMTGHVRADANVLRGTGGFAASKEVFTDTAQLIGNRIRFVNITGFVEQDLTRGFSARAEYGNKDYSDSNRSDDWQLTLRYAIPLANPRISLGYRLRYLDFRRETGHGYFDPSDFISHQAIVTLHYERGRFSARLEPYFGHQAFKRNGTTTDGTFGAGSGLAGWKVTDRVSIEANGEGGNYAVGTAAGFNYYLVGARLVVSL